MPAPVQPKLKVTFVVWGTFTQGVRFKHRGKEHRVDKLEQARDFAKKNGYSGIAIKCA